MAYDDECGVVSVLQ